MTNSSSSSNHNNTPTSAETTRGSGGAAAPRPTAAIILAAGKGTRMNSDLPKVAHPVADKPMVWWVARACAQAGASPIVIVIGYGGDIVRSIFLDDGNIAADDVDIRFAEQTEQRGTGHATLCAQPALDDFHGDVLVLAGDGPLIRTETIDQLRRAHQQTGAAATLATSTIDDPTGYGRIVRDSSGGFEAIVEEKNATADQKAIREIYPSYAIFDADKLFTALQQLAPDAVTGEFYLTHVPAMLKNAGERIEVVDAVPPEDVLSINTPEQLAAVDGILRARLRASAAGSSRQRKGATVR